MGSSLLRSRSPVSGSTQAIAPLQPRSCLRKSSAASSHQTAYSIAKSCALSASTMGTRREPSGSGLPRCSGWARQTMAIFAVMTPMLAEPRHQNWQELFHLGRHLVVGGDEEFVHFAPDGGVRDGGREVGADLAEYVFIALFGHVGDDHGFGVVLSRGAGFADFAGRPEAQQLVAPVHDLEAQILVVGPLGFIAFATLAEGIGHVTNLLKRLTEIAARKPSTGTLQYRQERRTGMICCAVSQRCRRAGASLFC